MITRRAVLMALAAIPLAGCGFRLRGSDRNLGTLPETLTLQIPDPYGTVAKTLIRELSSRGVSLVERNAPILHVSGLLESQRVLGPVTRNGTNVDQIELLTELRYRLDGPDLTTWIPETTVQTTVLYVEGATENSNETARVAALRSRLAADVTTQLVPSLSLRYAQWQKSTTGG